MNNPVKNIDPNGMDVWSTTDTEEIKRAIEILLRGHSILNNLSVTSLSENCSPFGFLRFEKIYACASEWVNKLSIVMGNIVDSIDTLSGGNQQKVVIAKWLETKPDLLLLNGPTVGVDIGAKFDVYSLIRDLVKNTLIGVIIFSDDLSEVIQNCNRVLVMKNGKITEELNNDKLDEARLTEILTN